VIQHRATLAFNPGTVVAQTPKPGAPFKAGQSVTVIVSIAPMCDPSYPTVCIAPFHPNLTCKAFPYRNFPVVPPDDDHLDPDHNGYACQKVPKVHTHPGASPSP
jgi:hypothetical protein